MKWCKYYPYANDYKFYKDDVWEIYHIIPREKGGSDKLQNLQALQWEENQKWKEIVDINKPGMNENLLEKYYNNLSSKEIADKHYNKQKYVSITMLHLFSFKTPIL